MIPAGRGTTTEPSSVLTVDITAEGVYAFPFRDNIADVVEPRIVRNDDGVPIAHVAPGTTKLRIRNRTHAAYALAVERYWANPFFLQSITIPANRTATMAVDLQPGAWYDLRADSGDGQWLTPPGAFIVIE